MDPVVATVVGLVVGLVAVRGTVVVAEAAAVREAEAAHRVGLVAASGGRGPGATPVEEGMTIGGSVVTGGTDQASGRIADVGVPMRRARPTGGEWHDVVQAVSSARNTRTAPNAGNGPPSGRPGLVVPSPSDPTD